MPRRTHAASRATTTMVRKGDVQQRRGRASSTQRRTATRAVATASTATASTTLPRTLLQRILGTHAGSNNNNNDDDADKDGDSSNTLAMSTAEAVLQCNTDAMAALHSGNSERGRALLLRALRASEQALQQLLLQSDNDSRTTTTTAKRARNDGDASNGDTRTAAWLLAYSATLSNLGCQHRRDGDADAAVLCLRDAHDIEVHLHGSPSCASLLNLSAVLLSMQQAEAALPLARRCVAAATPPTQQQQQQRRRPTTTKATLPEHDAASSDEDAWLLYVSALHNLAITLAQQPLPACAREHAAALPTMLRALRVAQAQLGATHAMTRMLSERCGMSQSWLSHGDNKNNNGDNDSNNNSDNNDNNKRDGDDVRGKHASALPPLLSRDALTRQRRSTVDTTDDDAAAGKKTRTSATTASSSPLQQQQPVLPYSTSTPLLRRRRHTPSHPQQQQQEEQQHNARMLRTNLPVMTDSHVASSAGRGVTVAELQQRARQAIASLDRASLPLPPLTRHHHHHNHKNDHDKEAQTQDTTSDEDDNNNSNSSNAAAALAEAAMASVDKSGVVMTLSSSSPLQQQQQHGQHAMPTSGAHDVDDANAAQQQPQQQQPQQQQQHYGDDEQAVTTLQCVAAASVDLCASSAHTSMQGSLHAEMTTAGAAAASDDGGGSSVAVTLHSRDGSGSRDGRHGGAVRGAMPRSLAAMLTAQHVHQLAHTVLCTTLSPRTHDNATTTTAVATGAVVVSDAEEGDNSRSTLQATTRPAAATTRTMSPQSHMPSFMRFSADVVCGDATQGATTTTTTTATAAMTHLRDDIARVEAATRRLASSSSSSARVAQANVTSSSADADAAATTTTTTGVLSARSAQREARVARERAAEAHYRARCERARAAAAAATAWDDALQRIVQRTRARAACVVQRCWRLWWRTTGAQLREAQRRVDALREQHLRERLLRDLVYTATQQQQQQQKDDADDAYVLRQRQRRAAPAAVLWCAARWLRRSECRRCLARLRSSQRSNSNDGSSSSSNERKNNKSHTSWSSSVQHAASRGAVVAAPREATLRNAVVCIQAHWRGYVVRAARSSHTAASGTPGAASSVSPQQQQQQQAAEERVYAVMVLQCAVRCMLARRARHALAIQRDTPYAVRIQRWYRATLAEQRSRGVDAATMRRRHAAATTVQRVWRGYCARVALHVRRLKRHIQRSRARERAAPPLLQRVGRAALARRRLGVALVAWRAQQATLAAEQQRQREAAAAAAAAAADEDARRRADAAYDAYVAQCATRVDEVWRLREHTRVTQDIPLYVDVQASRERRAWCEALRLRPHDVAVRRANAELHDSRAIDALTRAHAAVRIQRAFRQWRNMRGDPQRDRALLLRSRRRYYASEHAHAEAAQQQALSHARACARYGGVDEAYGPVRAYAAGVRHELTTHEAAEAHDARHDVQRQRRQRQRDNASSSNNTTMATAAAARALPVPRTLPSLPFAHAVPPRARLEASLQRDEQLLQLTYPRDLARLRTSYAMTSQDVQAATHARGGVVLYEHPYHRPYRNGVHARLLGLDE